VGMRIYGGVHSHRVHLSGREDPVVGLGAHSLSCYPSLVSCKTVRISGPGNSSYAIVCRVLKTPFESPAELRWESRKERVEEVPSLDSLAMRRESLSRALVVMQ